jgi:uncharacterized membrane protein
MDDYTRNGLIVIAGIVSWLFGIVYAYVLWDKGVHFERRHGLILLASFVVGLVLIIVGATLPKKDEEPITIPKVDG